MKRFVFTLFVAGCMSLAVSPSSAEAGILSRLFGRFSQGPAVRVVEPAANETSEAGRRYSYEPTVAARSAVSAPHGSNHLLPKTDPRRYLPN